MTSDVHSRAQAWTTTEPQSATFVELFFDLVFVFAVTQITALVREDLTWTGVGHGLIVLWLVWWAWTQFTWTLNPADTTHTAVRLLTLAATGVAFFMAQAVPDAFGDGGAWFAVAYVLVRLLGLWLQFATTTHTEFATDTRVWIASSTLGLTAVIVGGFVASPWREALWTLAILLDVAAAWRAGRGTWNINAEHFAERHGLIVIIALGESLIAAGIAVAEVDRDLTFALGAATAVAAVSAAWWVYFGSTKDVCEHALADAAPERAGAVARDLYSFGHLPVVGGVIAFAVAVEEVLAHPDEHLEPAALAALAVGVLLYVGGVAYGRYAAARVSLVAPTVTVLAVAAVAAATAQADGLVTLAGVAAVLIAYAFASFAQGRTAAAVSDR